MKCLKLSPNLRKQTQDVKDALLTEDSAKKVFNLEVKILKNILEMVRKPETNENIGDAEEYT